jgi:hypothetical protein
MMRKLIAFIVAALMILAAEAISVSAADANSDDIFAVEELDDAVAEEFNVNENESEFIPFEQSDDINMFRNIRVTVNSADAWVDGIYTPLSSNAFVDARTNRTMLPIRAIAEVFGVASENLIWNDYERSVMLLLPNRVVWLQIDSDVMLVNGKETLMADSNGTSVKPMISDGNDGGVSGRTYVPLRQLAEVAFGVDVLWIPGSNGNGGYAVLNPTQNDYSEVETATHN